MSERVAASAHTSRAYAAHGAHTPVRTAKRKGSTLDAPVAQHARLNTSSTAEAASAHAAAVRDTQTGAAVLGATDAAATQATPDSQRAGAPPAVQSLDATEHVPAADAARPIAHWTVIEPADMADMEIVQEDISAGVRCARVDIVRLFRPPAANVDTRGLLAELLALADQEGSRRLHLPAQTFQTAPVFDLAFCAAIKGIAVRCQLAALIELAHGFLKADLSHLPLAGRVTDALVARTAEIPALDLVLYAQRFSRPELRQRGIITLAEEKTDVPPHLHAECMTQWRQPAAQAEQAKRLMREYFATATPDARKNEFWASSYRGNINALVVNVARALSVPLA